ncbi:MAG: hypothetical protein ACK401_01425 [Archaeoglobaceae archaeon]
MSSLITCFTLLVFVGAILIPSMLVFKIFQGTDFTVELIASIATIALALLISENLKRRRFGSLGIRELIGGDRFYVRRSELRDKGENREIRGDANERFKK